MGSGNPLPPADCAKEPAVSHLRANELLGYPADARQLIINADDFGMYHAMTEAILRTLDDIFNLTVGLALEYGVALRVFDVTRSVRRQRRGLPTADHRVVDSTRLPTANKGARFVRMLRELPAGLSEWAVHPGLGTAEARTIDRWWAKRAADLRFLVSREARETVEAEGILLLDYRSLQAVWAATASVGRRAFDPCTLDSLECRTAFSGAGE
jgi:predicted glycoside hydrolase/deacetylase ChbG (UPF0249 family)